MPAGPPNDPTTQAISDLLDAFSTAMTSAQPEMVAVGSRLKDALVAGAAGVPLGNLQTLALQQGEALIDQGMMRIVDQLLTPVKIGLDTIINQQSDFTVSLANDLQSVTGMSAGAIMRIDKDSSAITKTLAQNSFNVIKRVAETEITMADGSRRIVENYANTTELFRNYTEVALNDTRLFYAASQGMNDNLVSLTTEGIKGLGMSAEQINETLQRELSNTGRITGEALDRQIKMIIAAHGIAGTNLKRMSHDIGVMINDYAHFGEMSEPRMLSLSSAIEKLGISIDDVRSIATKFQSFDSAIQTVNNFAAATGAALDFTGLFEKANEGDMLGMLQLLKDNLEESGIEFDSLQRQQKLMIANSLGIDPMILKRIMKSNFDSIEDISDLIEQESDKITDKQRQEYMMGLVPIPTESAEKAQLTLASLKNLSIDVALNIEKTLSTVYGTTQEIALSTKDNVNTIAKNSKELLDALRQFVDAFGKDLFKGNIGAGTITINSASPPQPPTAATAAPTPPAPTAAPAPAPAPPPAATATPATPAASSASLSSSLTTPATPPAPTPSPAAPAQVDITVTLKAGPEFGNILTIDNLPKQSFTSPGGGASGTVYVKFVTDQSKQIAP